MIFEEALEEACHVFVTKWRYFQAITPTCSLGEFVSGQRQDLNLWIELRANSFCKDSLIPAEIISLHSFQTDHDLGIGYRFPTVRDNIFVSTQKT
jgi:hypothetical protein